MSRALCLSLLALVALPAAVAQAAPASGPCLDTPGGPTCHYAYARLMSVSDGDTIRVRLHGHKANIRFVGIQAMELHRYSFTPSHRRGECHSLEAAAEVDRLMRAGHGLVRLASQHPQADSLGRLERSLAVKIGGRWRDVGQDLMAKGLTLWLPNIVETAWNRRYDLLGQQAAQRHIGMFDTTRCGTGPSQDVPLKVWAQSDPPGEDQLDLNGEWIKVRNMSATRSVSLAHWWARDSMLRRFTFPAGTRLAPGQTTTVHVGHGARSGLDFFWGLDVTIFQNDTTPGDMGDGAYLFDPHGDLRGWMIYPCLVACTVPDAGRMALTVDPRAESVSVHNRSGSPLDLYGYELAGPASYAFPEGTVLPAGGTLRVDLHGTARRNTALDLHAGLTRPVLRDAGGAVTVSTFNSIVLACAAWGYGRC